MSKKKKALKKPAAPPSDIDLRELAVTLATFMKGLQRADITLMDTGKKTLPVVVISHPENKGAEALCALLCFLHDAKVPA